MARKTKKEETVVEEIKDDLDELRKTLVDKTPHHFSGKDVVNAIFGALLIGVTFVLKGAVITTAVNLRIWHVLIIIISTVIILVFQTYFVSYAKVKDKKRRRPTQFIIKRVSTMYLVAIFVSLYLIYVFGINYQPVVNNSSINILKMVVLVSMPCSFGAAISTLLKREE